jgi:hypothetical protein
MGRRINTGVPDDRRVGFAVGGAAATPEPEVAARKEDFMGRLLKYIPAEIVGLYLAAKGVVVGAAGDDANTILWAVASLSWLLVPVYLWVATSRDGQKPLLIQILLASIAFPVWVFAISGAPVSSLHWYNTHQYIGSLALIFLTFAFGLIKPQQGV